MELCINSRDEIRIICLDDVSYVSASGNYSDFHLLNNHVISETLNLSEVESLIKKRYSSTIDCPFFRLGRSLLIHLNHVQTVSLKRGVLTFKSLAIPPLSLTKRQLKVLKQRIVMQFESTSSLEL